MTNYQAIAAIEVEPGAVELRKLGASTLIQNCGPGLSRFLRGEMSRVGRIVSLWTGKAQELVPGEIYGSIGQLGRTVWRCRLSGTRYSWWDGYGWTMGQAVENALAARSEAESAER